MISFVTYFVLLQISIAFSQRCFSGLKVVQTKGDEAIICDNGTLKTYDFMREGTIDKCPGAISKFENSVITCVNQKVKAYWLASVIQPRNNIFAFYPQYHYVKWK